VRYPAKRRFALRDAIVFVSFAEQKLRPRLVRIGVETKRRACRLSLRPQRSSR